MKPTDHPATSNEPEDLNAPNPEVAKIASAIIKSSYRPAKPGGQAKVDPGQHASDVAAALIGANIIDRHGQELLQASLSIRRSIANFLVPESELDRRQSHDALTGLIDQGTYLRDRPAAEANPNLAIVVFDANRFKLVNDRLGHQVGDALLQMMADVLRQAAAEHGNPKTYRIGGDELAAIVPTEVASAFIKQAEQLFKQTVAEHSDLPGGCPGEKPIPTELLVKLGVSLSGACGDTQAEAEQRLARTKDIAKYGQNKALREINKFIDRRLRPR